MPTVNVYVPDDLKARLDKANLGNLSSLAQEAWEAALERERLPKGEMSIDAVDSDGNDIELRFTGALIARSYKNGTDLYLTDEDALVSVEEEGEYSTFPRDEADEESLWNLLREDDSVAEACAALGIKRIVRL
jgi:hypothetical protein